MYSAFVRELRIADPDPTGNADTADVLLALRGTLYIALLFSAKQSNSGPNRRYWATGPDAGSTADIAALSTSALFAERALGSFRSSWLDRNATWLAFKGCRGHYSHNDLDVSPKLAFNSVCGIVIVQPQNIHHRILEQGGSFVLEMGGVRWAVDLGADSYGLKGCAQQQLHCNS